MHLINERHRTASKLLHFQLKQSNCERQRKDDNAEEMCRGKVRFSKKKKKKVAAAAATSGWGLT